MTMLPLASSVPYPVRCTPFDALTRRFQEGATYLLSQVVIEALVSAASSLVLTVGNICDLTVD